MIRRLAPGRLPRVAFGAAVLLLSWILLGSSPAAAHPLGNFSVNHLHALRFESDRVVDNVVIDTAEIPTTQTERVIDADGDGETTAAELVSYGDDEQCTAVSRAATVRVDDRPVPFAVVAASFEYRAGQAGLRTTRLECRMEALVDLDDGRAARSVEFVNGFDRDRVGWREITAVGDGVRIINSPVPQESITDSLNTYPIELLDSPLDVAEATFRIEPGRGESTVAAGSRDELTRGPLGFFDGVVERLNRTFNDLIGHRELTLGVGLLAVGLALVLGASHALLPGHGKTVMAAFIAGRQGSVRDAVIVGATVTGTHTGGVLVLGLALTLSTSLAGDVVLGWLGVSSGLLVAILGAGLLLTAIRHRHDGGGMRHGHTHSYQLAGPDHDHHDHDHDHDHHDHGHHDHDHDHHDHHDHHGHHDHHDHGHHGDHDHDHEHHDHDHHDHGRHPAARRVSRRGLVGMGIAGGLVPSPSALVILLSAIALGRTVFGILLVVSYGLGMAATLTAAGIVLVKLRDRLEARRHGAPRRLSAVARRWTMLVPFGTAALVLVVGLGLAARSVTLV